MKLGKKLRKETNILSKKAEYRQIWRSKYIKLLFQISIWFPSELLFLVFLSPLLESKLTQID